MTHIGVIKAKAQRACTVAHRQRTREHVATWKIPAGHQEK